MFRCWEMSPAHLEFVWCKSPKFALMCCLYLQAENRANDAEAQVVQLEKEIDCCEGKRSKIPKMKLSLLCEQELGLNYL